MEQPSLQTAEEKSSQHHGLSRSIQNAPKASILIAFGTGESYIFHVEDNERKHCQKIWEEIFNDHKEWSCNQFKGYWKPLGWVAKLDITLCPEIKESIESLKTFLEKECFSEFDSKNFKAFFFTPGVAVLVFHLSLPQESGELLKSLSALPKVMRGVEKERIEIVQACAKRYTACMNMAENGSNRQFDKSKRILKKFKEVDRKYWGPKEGELFPLFYVDELTYGQRIEEIASQIAGSEIQRTQQLNGARTSYEHAEVYVDWSEALVKGHTEENRQEIEDGFIIAMASWFALFLMNKLASIYLLEAFAGLVRSKNKSRPIANAIHVKSMAYMDVANAAYPIRWTFSRKKLYLLETIHRNWSSDRWWKNLEERMKLLSLHYERVEDEQNERSSKRIAFFAIFLTCFALVSAVADILNLAYNEDPNGRNYLKSIDIYISLFPVLIGFFLIMWLWLWPKFRSWKNNKT